MPHVLGMRECCKDFLNGMTPLLKADGYKEITVLDYIAVTDRKACFSSDYLPRYTDIVIE